MLLLFGDISYQILVIENGENIEKVTKHTKCIFLKCIHNDDENQEFWNVIRKYN